MKLLAAFASSFMLSMKLQIWAMTFPDGWQRTTIDTAGVVPLCLFLLGFMFCTVTARQRGSRGRY